MHIRDATENAEHFPSIRRRMLCILLGIEGISFLHSREIPEREGKNFPRTCGVLRTPQYVRNCTGNSAVRCERIYEELPNYGVAMQLRTFRTESLLRFRRKAIPKYKLHVVAGGAGFVGSHDSKGAAILGEW